MARGLGGLIGVGRVQKEQALAGLTRAAQLETQQEPIERGLEAQKKAAQLNVIGTGGGIGAAALLARGCAKAATTGAAAGAGAGASSAGAAGVGAGGGFGVLSGTAATGAGGAGTAAATTAAGGGTAAASGGAMASMAAAAPYVLLAIAGGYLLKKIFD